MSKYWKRTNSLDGAIMKAAMAAASVAITKDRGTRTMMKRLERSDVDSTGRDARIELPESIATPDGRGSRLSC